MKAIRNLCAAAAASIVILSGAAPALAGPKAVVELFTSQGCSSCPPADAFAGDLVKRDDVITLSLPVDYWDYLGWKDTFARRENTERQYAYARVRGDGRVYTPQIVINGGHHYVGSSRKGIERGIEEAELPVPVSMSVVGGELEVVIGDQAWDPRYHTTVRLVSYQRSATVEIGRGENTGRTITYYNVVRDMRAIGMWKGRPMTITLPLDDIMVDDSDGCAVIVQADSPKGPSTIIGAAKWERAGS